MRALATHSSICHEDEQKIDTFLAWPHLVFVVCLGVNPECTLYPAT